MHVATTMTSHQRMWHATCTLIARVLSLTISALEAKHGRSEHLKTLDIYAPILNLQEECTAPAFPDKYQDSKNVTLLSTPSLIHALEDRDSFGSSLRRNNGNQARLKMPMLNVLHENQSFFFRLSSMPTPLKFSTETRCAPRWNIIRGDCSTVEPYHKPGKEESEVLMFECERFSHSRVFLDVAEESSVCCCSSYSQARRADSDLGGWAPELPQKKQSNARHQLSVPHPARTQWQLLEL